MKIVQMIEKVFLLFKNMELYIRIKFLKKIRINGLCWIRGKVSVDVDTGADCRFGKMLVSMGPLYIKCLKDSKLAIGEGCFFNHNCSITCAGEVLIGDNCSFANNVVIVDHDHKVSIEGVKKDLIVESVKIGDSVWVGANVSILKGVKIGEGAVIAANSVVRNNVSPHTMVAGVPARIIKTIN